MKNKYEKLKIKYNKFIDTTIGKVIIFPFKTLFVIMAGIGSVIGLLFVVAKMRSNKDDVDIDSISDNINGNYIINKEIREMQKRINIIDNDIHKHNYIDLTSDEIEIYNDYSKNKSLKGKNMEEKKRILKTIKKIGLIRTPDDSIKDMEGLY